MSQNKTYLNAVKILADLEGQLSLFADPSIKFERLNQLIENHFEKCYQALAARKDELLYEVSKRCKEIDAQTEKWKTKLEETIVGCKETIKAGLALFKVNEIAAVGNLDIFQPQSLPQSDVLVDLPINLVETIRMHGAVSVPPKHCDWDEPEQITTVAGSIQGYQDGTGDALFNHPSGMVINPKDDCLYVCDLENNAIRKITPKGEVTTFVKLSYPAAGIALNYNSNTYFVTNLESYTIGKITATGEITTFAGSKQGHAEGKPGQFNLPHRITIDQKSGNLFVADVGNQAIRMITPQGVVSTLAGAGYQGIQDGKGKNAQFNYPMGMCFDSKEQALIVCDTQNDKLRKVSLEGNVTTICKIMKPTDVLLMPNRTLCVTCNAEKRKISTDKGNSTYKIYVIWKEESGCPVGLALEANSHSIFVSYTGRSYIKKITFK